VAEAGAAAIFSGAGGQATDLAFRYSWIQISHYFFFCGGRRWPLGARAPGAEDWVFACFCVGILHGIHRKRPTHALQRTAGTTPLSGAPCEFTGRVWEVACCSGKPKWKWAQSTARTEDSSRQQERHLAAAAGGTSVGWGGA
jgi:hypothetical protein